MTAIMIIEILLLAGMVGLIVWFNSAKYKDMQEWRARKSEIASLLQEREKTEEEIHILRQAASTYQDNINYLAQESQDLELKITLQKERFQDIQENIEYTETTLRAIKVEEREKWFQEYKAQQEKELAQAAKDFVEQFNAQAKVKLDIGADIAAEIAQLKRTAAAAIEVAKLREADRAQKDYYRLQVDESTLDDIKELQDVMNRLKQPEVLGKLIWKVYYEKAYTDLCGRLFTKPISGIYMITNLENEMCYVGQAVNIQERWKQHIKRGLGAETATQNKLYPAMKKYGVENFTFQIVEVVTDRSLLDEREDYWQDFYKAKEFGYSIK